MRKARLISSFIALIVLCGTVGCTFNLYGAGESGLAYSSTGRAFVYHEVDGDKEGKTSTSELTVDDRIVDKITGNQPNADPNPQ